MPSVKLTDALVRSAKPIGGKLTEYADTKEVGLALRVTPTGVTSWTFRYRTKAGQQKRLSIGRTRDVSLADARASAVAHRASVARGGDPVAEAQSEKAKAADELRRETVSEVGNWYFQECEAGRHRPNARRRKRQSTIDLERYYFDRHVMPALGKKRLSDLTRATVQAFIDDLTDRTSISTARRSRVILNAICGFAIRNDVTNANPVALVTVAATGERDRVLSDRELKALWAAFKEPATIDGAHISPSVAFAILLAMTTLQRRGEVTGMRLSEIDFERRHWTIPSHRTKNHLSHVVPLSDLALELIENALAVRPGSAAPVEGDGARSDFLFPSPRDPSKPIDPKAMTRAFSRVRRTLGLEDARPHDLRRTGATQLTSEALGFPRFVVSKVLNHASDTGGTARVTGIYDKNEYLPEKRRALDAWANRLVEIGEGVPRPTNVVQLERAVS